MLDIVNISQQITGCRIDTMVAPKRIGDPAVLVADIRVVNQELNWYPEYSDLATIVYHAW